MNTSIAEPEVQSAFSFDIPSFFKILITGYRHLNVGGWFRLTIRDFGAHNILVNDNFEIVGLIGFDAVMTAPIEVVAQYPKFTGLYRQPAGHVETDSLAIERINRTKSKLEEYTNFVERAESRLKGSTGNNEEVPLAKVFMSNAASIVQGLGEFTGRQKPVNDKWMKSYLTLCDKIFHADHLPQNGS